MRVPGESPAIPLVLSARLPAGVMIIYLTARPDRGPGLLLGLRPTRAQRRLLGLAPWRRLPVPLPRRRGTCVSLARYRYKRLARRRDRLPHRRLAPPELALCANFLPATGPQASAVRQTRTSPEAVPGSSSPGHPGTCGIRLPICPARSSTELSRLGNCGRKTWSVIVTENACAVHRKRLDGAAWCESRDSNSGPHGYQPCALAN